MNVVISFQQCTSPCLFIELRETEEDHNVCLDVVWNKTFSLEEYKSTEFNKTKQKFFKCINNFKK
jgi:hypothetical protein